MLRIVLAAAAAGILALTGCAAPGGRPVAQATQSRAATAPRTVSLKSGFRPDPYTLDLKAGGNLLASARAAGCAGYIDESPDLILSFTAGAPATPLYIFAYSDADTTLVVRTPSGAWRCNDDDEVYGTLDPWIAIRNPQSGNYSIWVGNKVRGEFPAVLLFISEIDDDI